MKTKQAAAVTLRNRLALAYLELADDPLFSSLGENEKLKSLREALRDGDEIAGKVIAEYRSHDPRKIAALLGIRIFGEEKKGLVRSEYRPATKEIVLSRRFHDKLRRQVHIPELSERLLKIVVAHELFHYFELERFGEVYKKFRFKAWEVGPFASHKQIKGLSEVAAQAFTQTLLGIELTPEVFDYMLMASFLAKKA
ncbi:hypothetical protein A3K48_03005 [candidate division WOR-1 bacterium RIFOXYA12_FULL_52_29]|uniref:Uncharacterized protein n=1 Tax=candidate division WOR-1 bacterium RIFOXYC12_FULL_54_18 TaxID=1802584 RepID=A0A1F4T781_UNCSA|nr:MAG: hypothetical protein A3K44_03005 [candidate division WOR-1 bacterium RIFOXYA2_FULL_51_19]OGC17536.1 MAG: hypothetical protein A3K48_03005 [candidate division WOR-1 bacterium RIFOXYA12_FULL_52_29]OGC26393.1 MAG: hypothetical protein A3K32_03000 [candidate division WOR-1 bacterium RIFOXYB2_FULL_45_9]OGC27953.1 MAG: hypothetical protein A3K49_03005 [candidate division WOR-1 bacterium RIFOXYC12_FULL_54_18]OGC29760.1 MAG: hypothetical protein A2346_03330 [candidate division WOR-1 bacterium R